MGANKTVRRAYGDFTRKKVSKDVCLYAENLFLTNPTLDGFVIVSSDTDFFRLAKLLCYVWHYLPIPPVGGT
jgi:uncharacterized LabA/DUF88 family protein